jgi:hypothetical protein
MIIFLCIPIQFFSLDEFFICILELNIIINVMATTSMETKQQYLNLFVREDSLTFWETIMTSLNLVLLQSCNIFSLDVFICVYSKNFPWEPFFSFSPSCSAYCPHSLFDVFPFLISYAWSFYS